jgi:hypothetical protein
MWLSISGRLFTRPDNREVGLDREKSSPVLAFLRTNAQDVRQPLTVPKKQGHAILNLVVLI